MFIRRLKFNQSYVIVFFLILIILSLIEYKVSAETYKFGELSSLAKGKTDKYGGFTEIYEHIFYPMKNLPLKICEIGIWKGGSLKLWEDYFPNSMIYGIDILDMSEMNSKRIKTFVADQGNRTQLKSFIDYSGGNFDFILDDGGHTMKLQQVSFGYLFKHVKPGGYYIIEDVHTSLPRLASKFGVEKDETNSTLVMINNFIKMKTIKSKYMTIEEEIYLTKNIDYCILFCKQHGVEHILTCIIKKKK